MVKQAPSCRPDRACLRAPWPRVRPFDGDLSTPFWSTFLTTGTTRPFGVSAAKPMWKYFLRTRLSPSGERAVEVGEFLQGRDRGLDQEGEHRHLEARLFVLLVQRDAESFELGDVGVLVVGDGRDHHPVARQVRAGDLLDARQRLHLDRAELGEVDAGPGQQIEDRRRSRRRPSRGGPPPASVRFTNSCTSSCRMRPFGPLALATRARSTPSSRANWRTDGCCAALTLPRRSTRRGVCGRRIDVARPARRGRSGARVGGRPGLLPLSPPAGCAAGVG